MQSCWLQLSYKTVIITGAGSGIGSAIAKAFAYQGCNVLLVDIHKDNVQRISQECVQIGQKLQQQQRYKYNNQNKTRDNSYNTQSIKQTPWSNYIVADITKKSEVHGIIQHADSLAKESSSIFNGGNENENNMDYSPPFASILVNAAGITRDKLIHNISEEDYDHVLNTNLKGTFLTCQSFCQPDRLDAILGGSYNEIEKDLNVCHGGHFASIINIGSIVSEKGNIGQCNYAASKGGVIGLTRALAKEMAFYSTNYSLKHKINDISSSRIVRVNAILPGFIETPMSDGVPDHVKERIKKQIPLGEFGSADDIANMALFLASSRSSYVTGATFECSGMIAL